MKAIFEVHMLNKYHIIFALVIIPFLIKAQGLNSNGSYIKINYPDEYETTIKKQALKEWGDDYSMVVYEINKQADALFQLIDNFQSENTNIVFKAIQEWSIEGYNGHNIKLFKEMKTFGLKELIKLRCDWSMVKYEYDKQVEAKNSF